MRASLQSQLAGKSFTSLPKLINKCISIEETWKRIKNKPEVNHYKRVNEIAEMKSPYLEYKQEVDSREHTMKHEVEAFRSAAGSTGTVSGSSSHKITKYSGCWNCQEPGHIFKDCSVARKSEFCYGCGEPGVLKPNCPQCRNSENVKRGAEFRVTSSTTVINPEVEKRRQIQTEEVASNTDPELAMRNLRT